MPAGAPVWMKAATFNADMYKSLIAAICRPGVGTLTDCLWGGARVFCYFEAGNREMINNAEAVSKAGIGENSLTLKKAYDSAVIYFKDNKKQVNQFENLRKISFRGASEAIVMLEDILSNKG